MQAVKIPFGKHLPDQPELSNPGSPFVRNVVPRSGFFSPMTEINPATNALDARVQGAIAGRESSGNVYTFAGDANKLYKVTGQTFSDVSRTVGGAYSTPANNQWQFVPWSDDILIGLNGVDAPQKIDPQTGLNFEALGGSPPAAKHGAVVRSFVMLGNWIGNENGVAWSAIDNAEEYNTNGTNQSDQTFLPSGGPVLRILGGEVGIVFAQSSIHRLTYVGSPVIFQRDEIGPGVGLLASGAAAQFGNLIFFIGQNSFYRMDARGEPVPIGESRWNKTFFAELDEGNADKITSAIDPINTIWVVAYPTASSSNGLPNRMFFYNWASDDCSFADIETEMIFGGYAPGIDLDNLSDATGLGLDSLPFSLDSRAYQGGSLLLTGFNRQHQLGFFSGATLEAEIETVERDGEGARLYISGARPLVDAPDAQISVCVREKQSSNLIKGPFTDVGPDGLCPQNMSGRFVRGRLKIPAGSLWTKAQGMEAIVSSDGEI